MTASRPATIALRVLICTIIMGTAALTPGLRGQATYLKPPAEIVKILEAPRLPSVNIDPTHQNMLLIERASMPPISDMAQPMWRIAGYRLNPRTSGPRRMRRFTGLRLQRLADGKSIPIVLPPDANVGSPTWSPDGSKFAFTITTDTSIDLWIGEAGDGSARRITRQPLNAAGGSAFSWMPDGRQLLCRFVPEGRGGPPEEPRVPKGPITQETSGRVAPVRTYQDLLQSPYDEARFDWIMTAQAALVDSKSGERKNLGKPAIWRSLRPSPDGRYILATRVVRPYSYQVTGRSFPDVVEVLALDGSRVWEVARRPLRDEVPIGGVPTGPRGISWCATQPAMLTWSDALDDGNPKKKVAHRDRVMAVSAPFKDQPRELLKLEHRFSGMQWTQQAGLALVAEYDRDRRWIRTWLYDMEQKDKDMRLVWDRSRQDRYSDPGRPVSTTLPTGKTAILVDSNSIYLRGRGASKQGDHPYLDRLSLETLKTERLWQCEGASYESFVALLDPRASRIITRYETQTEAPNYFVRDLANKKRHQITEFKDPAPELRKVKKQLVKYKREDGVELSATLYLPTDYKEGERRPLAVWAYPREFSNKKLASQVSGSAHRFTSVGGTSHLFLLTQGYVIMDAATMPVVGDPETCNDTFVEQIVTSAKAAIDKAVAMGVADRDRVGVGGHSYGAFMTANLLAHCDLFRAGIARSGAYNRTLTPFGFQSERRTFWQAPQIYFNLSPFMHANKINESLLLIHGEADNNSGTFPIQSKRLYHAIKGHGGRARLVMLPHESHGYRAKESVMHVLAEMVTWFDMHVKGAAQQQ